MTEQVIAQAAEAVIIRKGNSIIKRRIKKGYRINELDEKLRKLRTRSESKLLEKASSLISVPKVFNVDEKTKEIEMQFIEGKKLSEHLDNLKDRFEIMENVGKEVAKLHDSDIIHGDLTTSNMILAEINKQSTSIKQSSKQVKELIKSKSNGSEMSEQAQDMKETKLEISERAGASELARQNLKDNNEPAREESEVYIIDFGLGFISKRIEDRAVDLHLIKQALEAKHFKEHEKLFNSFLKGYKSKDKEKVLAQFEIVESRGRYKH